MRFVRADSKEVALETKQRAGLTAEEKNEYAKQYARLVKPIARRISAGLPAHLTFEDLLHEGIVGLLDALDRFDPSQGYELKTFATQRIKGAILDALRRDDFTGRGVRRRARELYKAKEKLSHKLGRTPAKKELADEAGITETELHRRESELSQAKLDSLQQRMRGGSGMGSTLQEMVADKTYDTAAQAEVQMKIQVMKEGLKTLPEREQMLLALYYNEGLNTREIAAIFSVSEARISQLHRRALKRVEEYMQASPLASEKTAPSVAV